MTSALRPAAFTAFVSAAMPAVLLAEVSDKVVTPTGMWEAAILGALVAFVAGWIRPALLWLALPAGLFLAAEGVATVLDEYVGPAVIREQGLGYAVHAFCSAATVIVGGVLGVWLHRRRKNSETGRANPRETAT